MFPLSDETAACGIAAETVFVLPEAEEIMCLYPVWLWVNTVLAYLIIHGTGVFAGLCDSLHL